MATTTVFEHQIAAGIITFTSPIFNLVPAAGEPARFGFLVFPGPVPVVIDTAVDPEHGYDVVASVSNVSELASLLSSQVTFWGVPGDPRHDELRGWECIKGGSCTRPPGLSQTPLLTLPSACEGGSLATLTGESWPQQDGAVFKIGDGGAAGEDGENTSYELPTLVGCGLLGFEPSIAVEPEEHAASTPTGLAVDVKLPQGSTLDAGADAQADVRDTTVTLPAGVQVNPAAANGLAACAQEAVRELSPGVLSAGGVGFTGFEDFQPGSPTAAFTEGFAFTASAEPRVGESFCPQASKLGTVRIRTPLLPRELEGAVYLAEPAPDGEAGKNPFDSLIALYIVAQDREAGVLVKLAGEGALDPQTGQITTTFQNTPQLPFEELKLSLFGGKREAGGERAPVSTPALCGDYSRETRTRFAAWSGEIAEPVSEGPFEILTGPDDGSCPSSPLAFAQAFTAQSASTQAGAFTAFELDLEHPDGDQALTGLTVQLAPGNAALLASVTPCPLPLADAGQCPLSSRIGESLASAGVGSEPLALAGEVFLTEGLDGAPFGVSVATPARAGPFDLGLVIANSTIEVNPTSAAARITARESRLLEADGHTTMLASPLPAMIDGIPVQLKRLSVDVNRSGFELNPTSCEPMSVSASLSGSEGAQAPVSSRFQVGGCSSLAFGPQLSASVVGQGSKAQGTTFKVTVRSGGVNGGGVAQAGIAKVDLQLPRQLSSRLPTLQKACVVSVFEANPAGCDPESVIGYATIHSPILRSPLTGPAYLVSHGGAAFPDVEFVLQGEGITIVLDGKTDIKDGVTYSKFESAPDAPFETFETVLPAGPHGVLTPNVVESKHFDLCGETLEMPTTIAAQDGGAPIERSTKVRVEGCGAVKGAKVRKLTRAQKLAAALKACRKHNKRSTRKRVACERAARRKYAVKKASTKERAHNSSTPPAAPTTGGRFR